MDILYITPRAAHQLTAYCESNLLIEVTEHFAKNAVIIAKDNDSRPSKWWDITDYIKDDSIAYRNKMAVILSFARLHNFNIFRIFFPAGFFKKTLLSEKKRGGLGGKQKFFQEFIYKTVRC